MSARNELIEIVTRDPESSGGDRTWATDLVDAFRAEVLAEVKAEVVAWLVKKAREGTPVDQLASKVDRGAVRAFLSTGHYRDAMDEHRAEVLDELARFFDERGRSRLDGGIMTASDAAQLIRQHAAGKDTSDAQTAAGESTQAAPGTCGRALSTGQPCPDHPFVPRTEREYWVDIADALNAANAAGMPVGIDIEGILTDHRMWAVVWNRSAERWEVGGYEDDDTEPPAEGEVPRG